MKMLETIHILPVRAESAAPAPLRGKKLDQRAVLQVVRKVDWKKAGLIAGGVTVVCAAAGTASRYKFYQGIVARELKKQLAPLNDKLDALQAENRMLRAELEKKNAPLRGTELNQNCPNKFQFGRFFALRWRFPPPHGKMGKTGLFSAKSLHCYPRLRNCLLQYMAFCAH